MKEEGGDAVSFDFRDRTDDLAVKTARWKILSPRA